MAGPAHEVSERVRAARAAAHGQVVGQAGGQKRRVREEKVFSSSLQRFERLGETLGIGWL
jgi:hypothetical protein